MGLLSGPLQMVLETHVSEGVRGDEVILGGWEVGFGIGGRVVGVWGGGVGGVGLGEIVEVHGGCPGES